MQDDYREVLVITVNQLLDMQEALFDAVFQLSMYGERKDLAEGPQGEVIAFTKETFADSKDANVQQLLALLGQVETTCDDLCSRNEIEVVNEDEDE